MAAPNLTMATSIVACLTGEDGKEARKRKKRKGKEEVMRLMELRASDDAGNFQEEEEENGTGEGKEFTQEEKMVLLVAN